MLFRSDIAAGGVAAGTSYLEVSLYKVTSFNFGSEVNYKQIDRFAWLLKKDCLLRKNRDIRLT